MNALKKSDIGKEYSTHTGKKGKLVAIHYDGKEGEATGATLEVYVDDIYKLQPTYYSMNQIRI